MKLSFTYRAVTDLSRLRSFIAKDNPQAARRISVALLQSIDHLLDHPQIGHVFDESRGVREWVSGDYVVHYMHEAQIVTILRIWHGKERHPSP